MLAELYDRGHDRTISRSFDKFRAILGPSNEKLMHAYMAEINLGVNGRECNRSRIVEGIEVILGAVNGDDFPPGTLLYCVGNGWFAIDEYEKARDAYNSALLLLDQTDVYSNVSAQCCKNLGAALEKLNKPDVSSRFIHTGIGVGPRISLRRISHWPCRIIAKTRILIAH